MKLFSSRHERELTEPFLQALSAILQAISAILQTIIIYINDSRLKTTFPCRLQGVFQQYKARQKEGHYLFVFIFPDPTMGVSDHTLERNHKDRKQTCENSIENHFTLYNRQIINNKVSSICTPRERKKNPEMSFSKAFIHRVWLVKFYSNINLLFNVSFLCCRIEIEWWWYQKR